LGNAQDYIIQTEKSNSELKNDQTKLIEKFGKAKEETKNLRKLLPRMLNRILSLSAHKKIMTRSLKQQQN
jgi:hypothetical protein